MAAETNNPLARSLSSGPSVSCVILTIAGLKVNVYGLSELPEGAAKISCLWLHHPRLRSKDDMTNIADQILTAYHQKSSSERGLIAVAFDQRNHGSRLVDERANDDWRSGNPTHAQDMFGIITGTVVDNINLLDLIEGHLFGAGSGPGTTSDGGTRHIDHNLVLGVSLGGHSAWQLLFAEPRVTAGVMVIGCPDYSYLMKDRARLSKLQTFMEKDGQSFFGSKDFPDALIKACNKYDPRSILFNNRDKTISTKDSATIRPVLDSRVSKKRFQVLSGGADKLVPYRISEPFMQFFKIAINSWYTDGGIYVEDNVYPGVGHEFNMDMKKDAVRFVLDTVALVDKKDDAAAPKI
ncbi:Alpha/Beta hydrolase protein [Annulohypoxylon maeteangense]|uniref:Alpha/Beta hydrolase protein n=1 Tax=Annulohypoxylon maeteangense TaxID=1927788 RepID=UPI00200735E5|nr:Alpha/Beta hydrolase protein [Annulohypoxylon maeteangense]KAI0885892.1 Alpha/Beta hydrolase protein [Annulohypoxylon maeteangense]